jgi:hypothetical protein
VLNVLLRKKEDHNVKTQERVILRVRCESGIRLNIPAYHTVFVPHADYFTGEIIDPASVVFTTAVADSVLCRGQRIIVDDVVEIIADVKRAVMSATS